VFPVPHDYSVVMAVALNYTVTYEGD
jgi:hypothetical protein